MFIHISRLTPALRCCRRPLLTAATIIAALTTTACATLQQPSSPPAAPAATPPVYEDDHWQSMQQRLDGVDLTLQNIEQQLQNLSRMRPPPAAPPPSPVAVVPRTEIKTGTPSPAATSGKTLVGRLEWLWVQPALQSLAAEIHTASARSYLIADDYNLYERDGERWISLTITPRSKSAKAVALDLKVEKLTRARPPWSSNSDSMPSVRLPVRLGNLQLLTDFLVTRESPSKQSVLLGRNFLTDIALVDVSAQYLQPRFETLKELEKSRAAAGSSSAP